MVRLQIDEHYVRIVISVIAVTYVSSIFLPPPLGEAVKSQYGLTALDGH